MRNLPELYRSRDIDNPSGDLKELLMPTLRELAGTFDYDRVLVAQVDRDQCVLRGTVGINVSDELFDALASRLDERGPVVQALLEARAICVNDPLHDPRVPENVRRSYVELGLHSLAAIPLSPVSCVLVVSRGRPVTEADINELLPYAEWLVAILAEPVGATGYREASEKRAAQNDWLWRMLNATQDPIILTDEQNNVLMANLPAERLLKASPEDSPGKRRAIELNNFFVSAGLSSVTLDPREGPGRELTLVDPIEGAELLFEVISAPAVNAHTGERGPVSVLKDVTDLRHAEDELRRSLEELRTAEEDARSERDWLNLILESVADPIVVTDPAGQIIRLNQPAERLLHGHDDDQWDQISTVYLTNEAKIGSFLLQLQLESAWVRRGELELVDPDSREPMTMGVTATVVCDELGQVTAIVLVLHDLTKARELERRTLEHQLFESEKLAAIGRMAAAVAHEVNNPLESITNALYLALSELPQGHMNRKYLEIASKETQRVSGIIRQMLGFYRPAASQAPTDVNALLEESITLLERHLRQFDIIVERELEAGLPLVLASSEQLEQVFLNLFLNAKEAMPGGGTLSISTRLARETDREFLAGRYILVHVRDTGLGIPPAHLPHIFDPFYSTKRESNGTGLGLWVSLGIVQNHGGQIKVFSRPGRGTTFTVALPPEGTQ
ncbi:MAG: PAS domain S-box protein [Chloroflexi bacterium]|nr:PAS domain S-box protein [Chloroflexota bacterium]